jgi:phage-related protein
MADDPIQNIQNYIHEVESAKSELDKANAAFNHHAQTFEKAEEAFEQHVVQFNTHIDDFTHTFESHGHETSAAIEHVGTLAQTHTDTNLTQVGHTVEESEKHVTETAQTAKTDITHAHDDLQQNGFNAIEWTWHSADQIADTAHEHNEQHFGEFKGHLDTLDQHVEQHQSNLTEVIHGASEEVTGNITSTFETAYSEFTSALHDTHTSDLTQGVSETHEALSGAYDHFHEESSSTSQNLMDTVGHSISEMGTHVGQEIHQGIQEAAEHAIEQALEGLIQDVVQSIAMMGVGEATTAAMSPIIPELAIAKTIVHTIDELLKLLSL